MKRYSKPLGRLLDFKQNFFLSNDRKLEEFRKIAELYRSQPLRTACKNCEQALDSSNGNTFHSTGGDYAFCPRCGHCNGAYEDTEFFCRSLYTADEGRAYSETYSARDVAQFQDRVSEIYRPKAQFLKESLLEIGEFPLSLSDFGAGAGYFVAAAMQCGFTEVVGYEPSETLVSMGNALLGERRLILHELSDIALRIDQSRARVASFIGVLEHLQSPRIALRALRDNDAIDFIYFSVPLFSPTVVLESVFPEVMPRHLIAAHTHLYTEQSIQHFCDEFGFERLSEWWFGLDVTDLYRSVLVMLEKSHNRPLHEYWSTHFQPLIDDLQGVLDRSQACSEVHMLLGKRRKGLSAGRMQEPSSSARGRGPGWEQREPAEDDAS